MTIRTDLNRSNLNQLADNFNQLELGELLVHLIANAAATEAGVVPAANIATLANVPSAIFQVNATAAASTGIKKLLKAPITGSGAVAPAPGQCVWDGALSVLFNTVDAVTQASFTYCRAATSASCMLRSVDETY